MGSVREIVKSSAYSHGFGVRIPSTPRPLFILEVTLMCHYQGTSLGESLVLGISWT